VKILELYFKDFIELKNVDLLNDTRSFVSGRLGCITRQASICRVAGSVDDQEFSSVMGTIHRSAVRGFGQVVSYDNTTVEYVCKGKSVSATLSAIYCVYTS
jgi:hypothetical protein